MTLTAADMDAIWLTLKLASIVTLILLMIATPLALWLAFTRSHLRVWVSSFVALPLVLPPTVLGFYLLIGMGPEGPLGQLTQTLGIGLLPFTFAGLVTASLFYSLPFVVQPIQQAFEQVGPRPLEVAAIMGASPMKRFFSVLLPLSMRGFLSAAILGFAHTVGEFGVILMIGGNIPSETRVLSIHIYDQVEMLNYAQAHSLSALLLLFSFFVLLIVYSLQPVRLTGGARA